MADREAEEPNVQYMEEVETTHVVQEIVLPDDGQLEATTHLGPNMVIQDGSHQQPTAFVGVEDEVAEVSMPAPPQGGFSFRTLKSNQIWFGSTLQKS